MMRQALFFLCGIALMVSCENETKEPLESDRFEKIQQLSWLEGNWSNVSTKEKSYENWSRKNDSTLLSHSFVLINNDTVFEERVTLQQIKNDVYFNVTTINQNDGRTIPFKMVESEDGVYTFQNLQHDFPNRISYSNPSKDTLHAWIEGMNQGQLKKVDFYYSRHQKSR